MFYLLFMAILQKMGNKGTIFGPTFFPSFSDSPQVLRGDHRPHPALLGGAYLDAAPHGAAVDRGGDHLAPAPGREAGAVEGSERDGWYG